MNIPEIDVHALAHLRDAGAPIIDVRQPDEYVHAHVAGAELIPLGDLASRLEEIPKGQRVYLICRSGARSMRACEFLAAQGYDVANVAGGTMGWMEAGQPVVSGPMPG
ncbi:MAG: rhodanese-like domain-containing protein [Acidimicrobiales bacterium]|nr:rhodanese-like domain-containing protein [Acidimicrobiales bacterium]